MITISELITKYRKEPNSKLVERLIFTGVEGLDVYNITAPFVLDNTRLIAGRVEARDSEQSHICFFEELPQHKTWNKVEITQPLKLQDPFYTWIDDKLILGGVEVFFDERDPRKAQWRTCLYEFENLQSHKRIFEGPLGMKDLRLKQLKDGRILVLTRPQGEKGGRGKIGCTIVNHLNELTIETIEQAPLLKNQFIDTEWGGANEIHLLNEGRIGVLGHIAQFDKQQNRHYYAMTFELDLESLEMKSPKIIAERSDFLDGPAKREDLIDVVFSGGLILIDDQADLYAGISDADAQRLRISNPFSEESR
ncbi:DUF1861 family protein [Virgibacillus proomii]|uniref:DUF1861 family protein n=1 Tax=Virgibacillus proomii TaxID=84407 RepID=UPI00098442D1|nr:DUF1861 family protein [Virgibacillus proomii]